MTTQEQKERARSVFLESESNFFVICRDHTGGVEQVFKLFWSEQTNRWACFVMMPEQVSLTFWERKGEIY